MTDCAYLTRSSSSVSRSHHVVLRPPHVATVGAGYTSDVLHPDQEGLAWGRTHQDTPRHERYLWFLAGNLWGLHERAVACATLEGFAQRLSAARSAILALLPQSEHAALEAFYARTVGAARKWR